MIDCIEFLEKHFGEINAESDKDNEICDNASLLVSIDYRPIAKLRDMIEKFRPQKKEVSRAIEIACGTQEPTNSDLALLAVKLCEAHVLEKEVFKELLRSDGELMEAFGYELLPIEEKIPFDK